MCLYSTFLCPFTQYGSVLGPDSSLRLSLHTIIEQKRPDDHDFLDNRYNLGSRYHLPSSDMDRLHSRNPHDSDPCIIFPTGVLLDHLRTLKDVLAWGFSRNLKLDRKTPRSSDSLLHHDEYLPLAECPLSVQLTVPRC
jgi:hypothetical protein